MKKNIKLKTWMTVAAVSICLNGILFYLFAISISISPSTISIGINLITLLGNFFLSFLVSIVYTYFCRISDEEKEKKREKEMEEKIQNIYLKMLEMAPTHVYPAANQPIEDFNQRLNRSISRTKNYFYFSDRGLYVVKRLKNDIEKYNERLSVSICLQDICDKSIFRARTEEYRKREIKQKGYRNLETIIRDEQLNILRVLYVISKLDDLDIRVYLHKEIPFIRFEITDDMLAISFLPMLMEGKKYPPTLIYENEILFRQSYMDYINDVMNRAVLLKKEELTLDFLIELGKKAGISDFTKEDIVCYYNEL